MSRDGNTLAVAAYYEPSAATGINGNQNDRSIPEAGAVYVFTRSGTTWSQQAYIKASNTGNAAVGDGFAEGDQFGYSMALSADGNTLAVGATAEDSAASGINGDQADNMANQAGAAYVYARNGSTWSQQAYVKSAMTRPGVLFGYSIGLSGNGDTLAVAEFDADRGKGALYVLARSGGTWSHQARIQPANAGKRRLARLFARDQRRRQHHRGWRCRRRLPDPGCQSSGLRKRPASGQFVRSRVGLRSKRKRLDPAGVSQVLEPSQGGLVRSPPRDQR